MTTGESYLLKTFKKLNKENQDAVIKLAKDLFKQQQLGELRLDTGETVEEYLYGSKKD